MTDSKLILIACLLDAWEKAKRIERTGVATDEELQLIEKFFHIERTTTNAKTTFLVKFSEEKAVRFSALLDTIEKRVVEGHDLFLPNQSLTVEGMRVEIAAGSRVAWVYIVGDEGVIITTQQLAAALRQIVETDGQQEAQP